ncbi:MAG: pantoate--beta-alanine ligase [Gammaproteobacteria bacterium]|nr:pantoate--beta-alanine ligase [Gammaproteobacteria bacterium]
MLVARTIHALRTALAEKRSAGRVGLVPTMGNLHDGHLALVTAAADECRTTVASIFVNPLQFGAGEDFEDYPRTFDADAAQLERHGVDILFAPGVDEVYPDGRADTVVVAVPGLSGLLCGADRPGHFDGVATVVTKLLNMVTPDRAYFGEKDWQQLVVIRTMARALNMTTDIIGVPTVRAADGLALSSRNQYLSQDERRVAAQLHRTLIDIREAVASGERDFSALENQGCSALASAGFEVDYVAVRDAETLAEPRDDGRALRVLAAARLGRARLIDNLRLVTG